MKEAEDRPSTDLERARMRLWSEMMVAALPLELDQPCGKVADAALAAFDKRFGEKEKG